MRFKRPNIHFKRPHMSAHNGAIIIKFIAFSGAMLLLFAAVSTWLTTKQLAQNAKDTSIRQELIAKANGRHIDCLADLFAKYTRDQKPIAKADLDKCQITEAEAAGILGSSLISGAVDFTTPPKSTAPAPQKTTSPNNNTNPPATSNQNPTSTQPPTSRAPEPVRVLGVPVCVPDPASLINGGVCVTH